MKTATATTVGELFAATVAEYEHEPALQTPDGTVSWTWGDYGRQAAAAAAGLAGLGVEHGSVVACWLTNRPEFHAADMGASLLGAASKLKRRAIAAKYATEIEGMCAES